MPRWWPWSARRERYRPPLACGHHHVDLATLGRWRDDAMAAADEHAVAWIAAGCCPVCRYAAAARPLAGWGLAGGDCACCWTRWLLEGNGWVATVAGGLCNLDVGEAVPAGVAIDAETATLAPFGQPWVLGEVLRSELARLPLVASTLDPRVDELIDGFVEALVAESRGQAIGDAEISFVASESSLDPVSVEALCARALEVREALLAALAPADLVEDPRLADEPG